MSTLLQGPRGNCGPIVCLSYHPAFCGPKNEKYLSGFDVLDLVELLWWSESIWVLLSLMPISLVFILLSLACKWPEIVCVSLLVVWATLAVCRPTCTQPAIVPRTLAEANTSAGLILKQLWAWGRWQQLLSANLPVDIVAVLADRQQGLVGWQIPSVSRLSFPIKPFHLNVQSTPWQARKNDPNKTLLVYFNKSPFFQPPPCNWRGWAIF